MAQEQQHIPPPSTASEDPVASLATPPAPTDDLGRLRRAVGEFGTSREDLDALFEALARPPTGTETPRDRADYLLSLLELREGSLGREGSDGRTLRLAAVDALLALGHPYALEVPPEALERAREDQARRPDPMKMPYVGILVTLLVLAMQAVPLFKLTASMTKEMHAYTWVAVTAALLWGLTMGPGLLTLYGRLLGAPKALKWGLRSMRWLGAAWLCGALLVVLNSAFNGLLALSFFPWHLLFLAAYLMRAARTRPVAEEEAEKTDPPPSASLAP